MNENSNVVRLRHPDEIDDPLTNILRSGARQLLARAIELEAAPPYGRQRSSMLQRRSLCAEGPPLPEGSQSLSTRNERRGRRSSGLPISPSSYPGAVHYALAKLR